MTSARTLAPRRRAAPTIPLSPWVIEANLEPPRLPSGLVARDALVELLAGPREQRIVALIAPAGYGKTTVLAQWRARERRPVAWFTVSRLETDPARLLVGLATSIDRAIGLDPSVLPDPSDGTALSTGVPRLSSALHRRDPSLVLIIDDVHLLARSESVDALAMLLDYLPAGIDVAVAGRSDGGLPLARLRTSGQLLDVGPSELVLSETEVEALVGRDDVAITLEQIRHVHERTEGWPAAVYLVVHSSRGREPGTVAAEIRTSVQRDLGSYLDDEFLGQLPRDTREFMLRTAIAEGLTGGLCDALTGRSDSAELLARLADDSGLVVALGGPGAWYRYHSLLREHLLALLDHEPIDVAALHRLAADWLSEAGMTESAIEHLLVSDPDDAAALIWEVGLRIYRNGRVATLLRWLERLGDERLHRHPYLAALGAWIEVLAGHADAAERLALLSEDAESDGPGLDPESASGAARASLRAVMAPRGLRQAIDDAEHALVSEPPWGRWRSTSLVVLGGIFSVAGERARAEPLLAEAMRAAATDGDSRALAFAAAHRAVMAIEADDWFSAAAFAADASAALDRQRLDPDSATASVAAVAARVAVRRNDIAGARNHLATFVGAKGTLTHAMPWVSVLFLLEAANAHLALADPAGARTVLRQAEDILHRRPDLGQLGERVAELRARMRRLPPGPAGASTLTPAEIRVLRLLPTYLSIPEIADRLNVAPSTVRTQVQAIFGKLSASSRAEAVESAIEAGLLEPLPVLAGEPVHTS